MVKQTFLVACQECREHILNDQFLLTILVMDRAYVECSGKFLFWNLSGKPQSFFQNLIKFLNWIFRMPHIVKEHTFTFT